MFEQFKHKTNEELDNQLSRAENLTENRIEPESIRNDILSMTLDEIKSKYPKEYEVYLYILKTEAKILSFPDINETGAKPKINLLQATTRGHSFKVDFGDSVHVIKPLESSLEKEIAMKASDLNIGPKQFKSKEGFLHEEFIDGTPLLKLDADKCTPEYMKNLGNKFNVAFKKLHENNILINDQVLTNDFGKSHMIIDGNGEVRFIDFGASIDITNYPDISDESVLSLIRTDPFMLFKMGSSHVDNGQDREELINGYRKHILSNMKTKEALLSKDYQLLNEGLYFLAQRLPNVDSFVEGMKK